MDELDFELIDESADVVGEDDSDTNEDNTTSDSTSKTSNEGNTSSAKGNKSNFKKMSKAIKALKEENAKLRKGTATKNEEEDHDEDEYDDETEGFDKTEFRFFLIENPEAKAFSSDIESIMDKYPTMDFEDALDFAKAKKPKESVSSDDFSTKSVNTKTRKRLSDLTHEEALKLPNAKYLEYERLKGTKI